MAAPVAAAAATPGGNQLTQSPTNLKEAIDWILRVTNKDGQQGGKDADEHCWCDLANGVADLLEGVEKHLDPEEMKIVDNILSVLYNVGGTKHVKALIEKVADQLKVFVGWEGKGGKLVNKKGIGSDGNDRNTKYASHYNGSVKFGFEEEDDDSKVREAKLRCAKILLGCIPFIFSGLSYLYWISVTGESESNTTVKDNLKVSLRHYVERMGYDMSQLWAKKTDVPTQTVQVTLGDLTKIFTTCGVLGDKAPIMGQNYATYLYKLRDEASKNAEETAKKLDENQKEEDLKKNALIKLNILCAGYFRSLHKPEDVHSKKPRTPNTVREILYWLTSLPYCPIYRTLVPKVQEMIQRIGSKGGKSEVVFYGSNWSGASKQLDVSAENCASYLLGAALIAPMVLLTIQDTIECRVGKDEKAKQSSVGLKTYKLTGYQNDVAIYDLYANMQFWFSYPMSETQSYYLLQDCLVALYYQLYFLECQTYSGYTSGYGWGYCKYGDKVKCDDCKSWICSLGNGSQGAHANGTSGSDNQCGNPGNASPLQAFLTDCLPGFTCKTVKSNMETYKNSISSNYQKCYMEFLEHRGHTKVFGTECAVPMGFSGSFREKEESTGSQAAAGPGNGMIGLGIYAVLAYYATSDMSNASLYQITRCICSLTRRVPRSTGTLYGFFYSIGGMCQSSNSGKPVNSALKVELECCPGTRDPQCLMDALFNWRGVTHTSGREGYHDNGTLDSLNRCETKDATCGYYLNPITGYLYNCLAPEFCETYVSWIVHLTWRLQSGLESLLKEFVKIDCSKSGCKDKSGKKPCQCPSEGCTKGTHGIPGSGTNKDGCCCESVADCAGVLGLFYRFGFNYINAYKVAGKSGNTDKKRTCSQFVDRLQKVIGGEYYKQLTEQLRKFIYTTRLPFTLVIFGFWSIVIGYLLWSMTFNLDLIHIQSHWRSTRSYLVPLQRILADGSRNVKRVCTIGYFQEANGDRLLSQGISDVYL